MSKANQYMDEVTDVFNFGKYKGSTLEHVMDDSPSYLQWCTDVGAIEFSEEMLEAVSIAIDNKSDRARFRNRRN